MPSENRGLKSQCKKRGTSSLLDRNVYRMKRETHEFCFGKIEVRPSFEVRNFLGNRLKSLPLDLLLE